MRLDGKALTASSHSFSAKPISPILIPLDEVSIVVLCACPRGTSSPSAGSVTLASSQGKAHCDARYSNWGTPMSSSWFFEGQYERIDF